MGGRESYRIVSQVAECLRNKVTKEQILAAQESVKDVSSRVRRSVAIGHQLTVQAVLQPRTLTVSLSRAVPWAPYLDGDILKDNPVILLRQGRWNQVPLIMGTPSRWPFFPMSAPAHSGALPGSTKDDALMFVHLGYKARLWYSPLVAFIEVMFGVSGHGSQALQMYKVRHRKEGCECRAPAHPTRCHRSRRSFAYSRTTASTCPTF